MIIKKLTLNNFICYYDNKIFEFSPGLNIILGHNGDGKSTIFTAFNWIFDINSKLALNDLYSKKKYSEILENENFEVYIEFVISQYENEYKISKLFSVTKINSNPKFSNIKEEIWEKNINTGNNILDRRTIFQLSQQVFPEAFRNFSMFETETDALKIVEGKKLSELVKNFSYARHYDKLDLVIEGLLKRADFQFRKESRADKVSKDRIDEIDSQIELINDEIKALNEKIIKDEEGREFLSSKIDDLLKNLTISESFNKIEYNINKLQSEIETFRISNKAYNRFTDKIFDDFYLLIGFDKIISEFSNKINHLRQNKNKIDNDERNKFTKEKLQLDNGATPFPPGFPSLDVLEEILNDNICKICNTKLENNSIEFINNSINLFKESRKKEKELEMPTIFPNNFIDELQIINHSVQLKPGIYSENRIKEEIEFGSKRITENNTKITENQKKINELIAEKKELLNSVTEITEDEVKNIRSIFEQLNNERDVLVTKIGENNIRLGNKNNQLRELQLSRTKTLSQFTESTFKQSTVEVFNLISNIAKTVKEDQYQKFLKVLSERASSYLKKINVGEITGRIELYKKNQEEVAYKSFNEDNSIRSPLEDSGAVQISKPISILFAIADIASEMKDNEMYPMIFDAPTSRYSPDREREFFKVLKMTGKQRIVVTLRFLEIDEGKKPFVVWDSFNHIEKDKAFFIKRVRPFDENKPETINTEIEILPNN